MVAITEPAADERTQDRATARIPSLSIVLPCHNEEDNVVEAISGAREAALRTAERFEVIVVDDGSSDATAALAHGAAARSPFVRVVSHPRNRGYGAALRTGIGAARMDYVFLTDADLQFDLAQLERFLPFLDEADLMVGYRIARQDPWHRRATARAWNALVRTLFALPVRDVDCAFKLIRRELLEGIEFQSDGAMVSTELLVRCMQAGATLREIGVEHRPRVAGVQSGNRPDVVARAFRELFALRQALGSAGDAR